MPIKFPFVLEHPPEVTDVQFLIVRTLGFLLIAVLIVKWVWPTYVQPHLSARQTAIAETADQIERTNRETEEMQTDYRRRLEGIEQETQRRIADAIREAEALRESILAEAQSTASGIVRRSQEEVARERAKAMVQLRAEFIESVIGAARHAAVHSLDGQQRRLVDSFVRSLGANS